MVHCHHASNSHRYGDMALQTLDARTWTRKIKEEKEEGEGKGKKKWNEKRKKG